MASLCADVSLTLQSTQAVTLSQYQHEVGTLAVDRWAVTYGTVRRGVGRAAARPGPSLLYQM